MQKKHNVTKKREKKDSLERESFVKIKRCRFCKSNIDIIDYKDLPTLERLISERGKILSRRITGTCAKHQRRVAEAIKRARYLALLPYTR